MNEVRLTVSADDIGVVSQVLVDIGVGFRVEPAVATAAEARAKRAGPPTAAKARKAAKRARATARRSTKSDAPVAAGAERLRDAIARTLPGPERNPPAPAQPSHPSAPATEPRDDLA
jgi:hypothetical protein